MQNKSVQLTNVQTVDLVTPAVILSASARQNAAVGRCHCATGSAVKRVERGNIPPVQQLERNHAATHALAAVLNAGVQCPSQVEANDGNCGWGLGTGCYGVVGAVHQQRRRSVVAHWSPEDARCHRRVDQRTGAHAQLKRVSTETRFGQGRSSEQRSLHHAGFHEDAVFRSGGDPVDACDAAAPPLAVPVPNAGGGRMLKIWKTVGWLAGPEPLRRAPLAASAATVVLAARAPA